MVILESLPYFSIGFENLVSNSKVNLKFVQLLVRLVKTWRISDCTAPVAVVDQQPGDHSTPAL